MKYQYDETSDALFIRFRDGEYDESEEIYDGFVIDFDKSGRPIGIDIYSNASQFVDIAQLQRSLRPVEGKPSEVTASYLYDAPLDKKKP
jgi:uncharacterized protein YuzE